MGAYGLQRLLLIALVGFLFPAKRILIESVVDSGFGGSYGFLGPWIHLPILVAAFFWFLLVYYLARFYIPIFKETHDFPKRPKRFRAYWRTSGWFDQCFVVIVSIGFLLPFAILAGVALSVQSQ